jgi:hypothetical protein
MCFCTNLSQTTAPLGIYFRVQCTTFYLPGLKNVVANGSVATTEVVDPVDFEKMAAEQSCCAEMLRLLGGTSLQLAFCQTGTQRLAGDVSTGVF